jgi:hypothetical protein
MFKLFKAVSNNLKKIMQEENTNVPVEETIDRPDVPVEETVDAAAEGLEVPEAEVEQTEPSEPSVGVDLAADGEEDRTVRVEIQSESTDAPSEEDTVIRTQFTE